MPRHNSTCRSGPREPELIAIHATRASECHSGLDVKASRESGPPAKLSAIQAVRHDLRGWLIDVAVLSDHDRRGVQDHKERLRYRRRTALCPQSRPRYLRRSRSRAATRSVPPPARGSAGQPRPHTPSPRRQSRNCGSCTGRRAAAVWRSVQQKPAKRLRHTL